MKYIYFDNISGKYLKNVTKTLTKAFISQKMYFCRRIVPQMYVVFFWRYNTFKQFNFNTKSFLVNHPISKKVNLVIPIIHRTAEHWSKLAGQRHY